VGEDRDKLAPEADVEAHKKSHDVTDEPDESKKIGRKEADDDGDDVEAHKKAGRE
jgi:hypothetical protein